jgi:hypothetical protein
MSESIKSPPYPDKESSQASLLSCLQELRRWVNKYREPCNVAIGSVVVPLPTGRLTTAAYSHVPVRAQFSHLLLLRKIREQWDALVRAHEADWDSPESIRARTVILASAASLVNGAIVPVERREAAGVDALDELGRAFQGIRETIDSLLEAKTREVSIEEEPT